MTTPTDTHCKCFLISCDTILTIEGLSYFPNSVNSTVDQGK